MIILTTGFVVALLLTLWVVRRSAHHLPDRVGALDHDLSGPQKFHEQPVPRVGGIGIFVASGCALVALAWTQPALFWMAMAVMGCAIPAFAAGLVEDLTKKVSPFWRLVSTGISAGLGALLLSAVINRTSIAWMDAIFLAAPWLAVSLTVFVVAGVANSLNIIDGFNGLASMCAVLMLMSFGFVGFEVGDSLIVALALAGIGAILGFFVWNFPAGLIFLGDGGAYFLGFYVAELAILLVNRNPSVSPMFPMLVCIYPIFETVFSIYRRRVVRSHPAGMPDGIHLHSLVFRRVMRWASGRTQDRSLTLRNSMTSPVLWLLCMLAVIPATLFWSNTPVLVFCIGVFVISYVLMYRSLVLFRTPRWLKRRKGR